MKLNRILAVIITLFTSMAYAQSEPSVHLELPAQLRTDVIPQFSARDSEGEHPFGKRQLERLAGPQTKRVALVFFATWCMPCAKGAAIIKKAEDELKKNGVTAVFVNVGEKDVDAVHKWIERYGDPRLPLITDPRSQMTGALGLLESNGSIVMPKILVLNEKLKPLFLLGTEGDDFPEILWKHRP